MDDPVVQTNKYRLMTCIDSVKVFFYQHADFEVLVVSHKTKHTVFPILVFMPGFAIPINSVSLIRFCFNNVKKPSTQNEMKQLS